MLKKYPPETAPCKSMLKKISPKTSATYEGQKFFNILFNLLCGLWRPVVHSHSSARCLSLKLISVSARGCQKHQKRIHRPNLPACMPASMRRVLLQAKPACLPVCPPACQSECAGRTHKQSLPARGSRFPEGRIIKSKLRLKFKKITKGS